MVKVADFGAASVCESVLTGEGESAIPAAACSDGTPCYMSPEQFTARSVAELTEAADIYSLGVILFEILNPAHRPPFVGSYKQLCRLHQAAPIPNLPELHETEAEIVRCCMAKDPRDRFESVEQLLEAVDTVIALERDAQSDVAGTKPSGEPSPFSDVASEDQRKGREEAAEALYGEVLRQMECGGLGRDTGVGRQGRGALSRTPAGSCGKHAVGIPGEGFYRKHRCLSL